jgi:hypothetical protein
VDGSIAGSSGVTVESGATLDGKGTVPAVTVQPRGTLEPASGSATAVLNSTDLRQNSWVEKTALKGGRVVHRVKPRVREGLSRPPRLRSRTRCASRLS